MRPSAQLIAVGMRTAVGLDALQTAMLYRAGAAGMREAPIVDVDGDTVTLCHDPTQPPLLAGWERAVELAVPALDECLRPLADRLDPARTRFWMCLDERFGKAARGSDDQAQAAAVVRGATERVHAFLPGVSAEVVARGGASGALAVAAAVEAIASRQTDAVLLGAAHTDYDVGFVQRMSEDKRIFKPDNLDAFIPGEAACFLLLARDDVARRLGAAPMAGVVSAASGHETATEDNDHSRLEARGLTATVRAAAAPMAEAGLTAGWAITDLTFERRRVLEWQAMLIRTRKLWSDPYVVDSPAQRIGRLGAAAILVGLGLAAVHFRAGSAPSPRALIYGGSDDGARGAVLVTSP
jgi:3-oxoacyl-[acyl-carrier-protein] synthase I